MKAELRLCHPPDRYEFDYSIDHTALDDFLNYCFANRRPFLINRSFYVCEIGLQPFPGTIRMQVRSAKPLDFIRFFKRCILGHRFTPP